MTLNVEKIQCAAHKNGDVDGTCKRTFNHLSQAPLNNPVTHPPRCHPDPRLIRNASVIVYGFHLLAVGWTGVEQERQVVDAVDFTDGSYNAKSWSEHRSPTTLTDTAATTWNISNCIMKQVWNCEILLTGRITRSPGPNIGPRQHSQILQLQQETNKRFKIRSHWAISNTKTKPPTDSLSGNSIYYLHWPFPKIKIFSLSRSLSDWCKWTIKPNLSPTKPLLRMMCVHS